jgi:high affinity cGMP-specific 3',5'-cyclic phosphodiesterase 9
MMDRSLSRLHVLLGNTSAFIFDSSHTAVDLAVLNSVSSNTVNAANSPDRPQTRPSRLSFTPQSQMSLPAALADRINSWELNPLYLSDIETTQTIQYIFLLSSEGLLVDRISEDIFRKFLQDVQSKYNLNPYHKWAHAVDVCHTLYRYLHLIDSRKFLRPMDRLGLLLGALIHDIGHPGVNNQFLIDTGHELAIRFNDKSPLENYHCSIFFDILRSDDMNVLSWLSREQFRDIRKVIIESVLHTDNFYHFGMVKEVSILLELNSNIFLPNANRDDVFEILKKPENRSLINKLLMHSADISNPTKPFKICKEWALLVMEEFFAQGDRELDLGIPVQPLNDRTKVNIPQSQVGFVEFVVAPLMVLQLKIFPVFSDNCQFLISNLVQWASEYATASNISQEEETKLLERCRMVANAFQDVAGMGGVFIPQSLRNSSPSEFEFPQSVLP